MGVQRVLGTKSLLQLNAQNLVYSVENILNGAPYLEYASYGREFFVFDKVSCTGLPGIAAA
jgi:hypothetical protein